MVKGKLVKYLKVSKYYEHGCLQNFLLLLISSLTLTAPFVKNSHVLVGIFQTWKYFITKFGPNINIYQDRKSDYQANEILVNGLRVAKFVKKNQVWKGLSRVRSKSLFPRTILDTIFEINPGLLVK